jgi:ATP-binding cassette, subfamily B, bacterial
MSRRNSAIEDDAPKGKLNKESLQQAMAVFKYIRPYRWQFILGMVLLVLTSLVFMVFPYLIGLMIDIAEGKSDLNLSLNDVGLGLVLILLVQGFISYARVLLFAEVSEKGVADIRTAVYKKIISLPITFFEENKTGDLISRITADVERLYNTLSITLAELLRQIIILVIGIGFLVWTTPRLSMVMLVTIPVVVGGAMIFGRYIRKLSKERQDSLAASNSFLSEALLGIQVIKAFTSEIFETKRYSNSINEVVRVALNYARSRAIFVVFIITIMFGGLFFVIWQGAVMLEQGTLTPGALTSFVTYTFIIGGSIASLGNFVTEVLGALGATERIRTILEDESEVDLTHDTVESPSIEGNISFKNVHFTYPTRKDIPILKGISIDIPAGQKVALVGSSGAGKSTIIQLLLRFYGIESGDILVDGKSIYSQDLRAYRSNIAIVPQEVTLFGGTIRDNILYGKPDASDEEVTLAAQQANAWEFISSFPEGLDTLIGERGIKLSGGQRQRVAIARAILKNPTILLLDEATSSLDAESEKVVQEALEKLMVGRTSIIIAHRLSTIRDVDTIYVLDNGQIAEIGNHETLLAIEDGIYSHLAGLQFKES